MTSGEESISRTTSDKLIAEKDEMSVDIRAFSGDHERETEFQLRTKPLPRRRLVGPVFLILFVSFASIIGFLWLSTRGLNEDALEFSTLGKLLFE